MSTNIPRAGLNIDPYAGMSGWGMPELGTLPTQGFGAETLPQFNTGPTLGNGGWSDMFSMKGLLGGTDSITGAKTPGWGGMALGAAQGLAGAYMGMKQYGLAKDTFNQNKKEFQLNYDAQKKTTNSALEDRQKARIASNPGAYQSLGDYMKQNGI